jgi:2-phosphosulfolactate phosphatase
MSAPDVQGMPSKLKRVVAPEVSVQVHLTPATVKRELLDGASVVVIDALRASVSMTRALEAGAVAVYPVLTVAEAFSLRERFIAEGVDAQEILLGGERGGVRVEGFDCGNSPSEYASTRVGERVVIFTSTNGTAAMHACEHAAVSGGVIVVGSLVNVGAVCEVVGRAPRPIQLVCSGTRDEVTLDDCIAAGAIVERLVHQYGRQHVSDDSGLLCEMAWEKAQREGVGQVMRMGRGGRNLMALGLEQDIDDCSQVDSVGVCGGFEAGSKRLRLIG